MKNLQHLLAFGCMAAWLWLALHGYGEWDFSLYGFEYKQLNSFLPGACLTLLLVAYTSAAPLAVKRLTRLWPLGTFCMMLPVFLGAEIPFVPSGVAEATVSLASGLGFGVCFALLGNSVASLPLRGVIFASGAGMLFAHLMLTGIVFLPRSVLPLMAFILSACIKLSLPTPFTANASVSRASQISRKRLAFFALAFLCTGFSRSLFYGVVTIMSAWVPEQPSYALLIPGAGCLFAMLCIQLSLRSPGGRALLLAVPILMVGYTAWPLLHRESLGLSLVSLSFASAALDVFCYLALYYTTSRVDVPARLRLLGVGGIMLLLGVLAGSVLLPQMRDVFSQGTTVNYLFAFLAGTLLCSGIAFVLTLEGVGFWSVRASRTDRHTAGVAFSQTVPSSDSQNLPAEWCDALLKEMDLTRQQAVIARMIAERSSDADICKTLSISQTTLKTHIRNILKRLEINSRHEIRWLLMHKFVEQERMQEAGRARPRAPYL